MTRKHTMFAMLATLALVACQDGPATRTEVVTLQPVADSIRWQESALAAFKRDSPLVGEVVTLQPVADSIRWQESALAAFKRDLEPWTPLDHVRHLNTLIAEATEAGDTEEAEGLAEVREVILGGIEKRVEELAAEVARNRAEAGK